MHSRQHTPFLYPLNTHGLIIMGIITVQLYVNVFVPIFPAFLPYGYFYVRYHLIMAILLWGYYFMYINRCVLDSVEGGLTAPDLEPGGVDMGDLADEFKWGFLPVAVCFAPSVTYIMFVAAPDSDKSVFMSLIGGGLFFCPMAYLRGIMFRERAAFNPVAIVFNIIRFFPGYLLLLICIAVTFTPIAAIYIFIEGPHGISSIVAVPVFVYCSVVMAHFIGRFYYLRSDKLDWA